MPTRQEVTRSIYGVWRLALLDASGFAWLNVSIDGFWRSFFAAILVAPLYVLIQIMGGSADGVADDLGWVVLVKGVGYALSWIIFPVVMLFLSRMFALADFYVGYIIAVNWSSTIQIVAFFAVVALTAGGVVPAGMGALLITAVTAALLFYQWFIARVALQVGGLTAAGLVAIDVLLGVFINLGSDSLIAAPPA